MKVSHFVLSLAVSWGLCHAAAWSQEQGLSPIEVDESSGQIRYIARLQEPSPSDQPIELTPVQEALAGGPATTPNCTSHYSGGCDSNFCESQCGCAPWKLIPGNPCGIEFGGWLNFGIATNSRDNATNYPVAFTNRNRELTMNQLWGYAEKKANTGGCGTDWGFRVDYVYGADGPNTQAFGDQGWDFGWDTSSQYGSAIPQIYGELAWNDWSMIVGHFFTIIGYESVMAPKNFFYSHSYTMNYGEPFTHTGMLLKNQVSDSVTAFGGYTFGWDSGFDNFGEAHTFLGGLGWQATDQLNLAYMFNTGSFGNGGTATVPSNALSSNIYMHSIVATYDVNCRTQYVFQSDIGTQQDGGLANEWYGVNQYLFYKLNNCWKAGVRYEWFRDDDGSRIPIPGNNGTGGDFQAATLGLNWMPNRNWTVRPEARWDWADNNLGVYGGQNSMFTLGCDAVFTF